MSVIDNLKEKPILTTATAKYYSGNLYIEKDGEAIAVDIHYIGIISGTSNLPQGYMIADNNERMLILRMTEDSMPEHILSYEGEFILKRVELYNVNNKKITASIETFSAKHNEISDTWSQLNSNWVEYTGEHYYGQSYRGKKSNIVQNNLTTDTGNLFLRDGTAYMGDYHLYSSGRAMSGKEYSEDSEVLYRKKRKIRIKKRKIVRPKQLFKGKRDRVY